MRKLKFRTDDKELVILCHSGINTIHPILRMTLCSPFLTLIPPLSTSLVIPPCLLECHYQSHLQASVQTPPMAPMCRDWACDQGRLATGHSLSPGLGWWPGVIRGLTDKLTSSHRGPDTRPCSAVRNLKCSRFWIWIIKLWILCCCCE